MIIDLHSHSIVSDDGRAKVENYCQWIRKKSMPLDGLVLTEHRLYDDASDYRHLEDEFGYGASVRGVFLALPAVPSMIVAFNIAAIRERIAPKALLAISSLVLAGGFALMGSTTLAVLVVIGCVAYGLGGAGEGGILGSGGGGHGVFLWTH